MLNFLQRGSRLARQNSHSPQETPEATRTGAPILKEESLTPDPKASRVPEMSHPPMWGMGILGLPGRPSLTQMSRWFKAQDFTLTRTSPSWGWGSGMSAGFKTSRPPCPSKTTDFMKFIWKRRRDHSPARGNWFESVSSSANKPQ